MSRMCSSPARRWGSYPAISTRISIWAGQGVVCAGAAGRPDGLAAGQRRDLWRAGRAKRLVCAAACARCAHGAEPVRLAHWLVHALHAESISLVSALAAATAGCAAGGRPDLGAQAVADGGLAGL